MPGARMGKGEGKSLPLSSACHAGYLEGSFCEYRLHKTKDRKQNNSKQDLTTKRLETIQIQCSPVLAEGPTWRLSMIPGFASTMRLSLAGGIFPGGEGTPLYGLYGDVPLDRVWFLAPLHALNRVIIISSDSALIRFWSCRPRQGMFARPSSSIWKPKSETFICIYLAGHQ